MQQLPAVSATIDLKAAGVADVAPAVPTSVRGPVLAGLLVVAVAFGGFGTWSALAPLNSAVVARGTVTVSGNRKDVQHLEGGIVKELLVRDGDTVAAGDVLMRMDPARAQAGLGMVRAQLDAALALEARLLAERDQRPSIAFPDEFAARTGDPALADAMAGQQLQLETRRSARDGQVLILRQRGLQYQEQITGLEAQIQGKREQIRLLGEELAATRSLFEKGHAPRTRVLALERETARLGGEIGAHTGDIARARQAIGEADLQVLQIARGFQEEVAQDLRKVRADIAELRERLAANEDMVRRLEVRAPAGGVVVGSTAHTEGGVIAPGAVVMQIVPRYDDLVVEAQIMPNDIGHVHAGQETAVRFPAFADRTTPTILGTVTQISADRLVEPRTGMPYYLARVSVPEQELAKLGGRRMLPGMAAELMLTVGERSALHYLLSPLTELIERAMREI